MTTVQFILIIIAIVIMVAGLLMIIRALRSRNNRTSIEAVANEKNGIPIIPRHQRNLVESEPNEQAIDGNVNETTALVDDEATHGLFSNNNHAQFDEANTIDNMQQDSSSVQEGSIQNSVIREPQADDSYDNDQNHIRNPVTVTNEHEEDLFSTLASATANLMPVIETADEPDFSESSSVIDEHLLETGDYDKNSPLKNAQQNVNITLVPNNNFSVISGATVLSLVEQYGLKFGAMNMFHRYENKDGSGILWFSMMGLTDDGIVPFDLNSLPTSEFKGLVLFLSLPHPKAMQGFDSMMSIVGLISKQLDMQALDENNHSLTRERKKELRAQVQEYQRQFY